MCGRFVIFDDREDSEIRRIINAVNKGYRGECPSIKTGEIFPADTVPVIASDRHNRKVAALFRWGFPNRYKPGSLIINARSETIDVKPTFSRLLLTRRCLIPASGFYEWKKNGTRKEKYLIRPTGRGLFYMAGLYDTFTGKEGLKYTGFVIITTRASGEMQEIYGRMPAILEGERATLWLRHDIYDPSYIKELLIPYNNSLCISRQLD